MRSGWFACAFVLVSTSCDLEQSSAPAVTLASNQNNPWTIAVDAENVYWLNAATLGGVYKVPKTGGAGTALYQGALEPVESLGVDATSVYFVGPEGIMSVPIAGGAAKTVVAGARPKALAVANGELYWADTSATQGPMGPPDVWRAPVTGGTPVAIGANDPGVPGGGGGAAFMTATDDAVYATLFLGGRLRIPLGGGSATYWPGSAPAAPAKGLAVDATDIYFASLDALSKVSKSGGTPVALLSAQNPIGVAVDDSSVYFTDNGSGRLVRVTKSGGVVTTVAENQGSPHAIAVDDTSVYWNCIGEGTIKKMAK